MFQDSAAVARAAWLAACVDVLRLLQEEVRPVLGEAGVRASLVLGDEREVPRSPPVLPVLGRVMVGYLSCDGRVAAEVLSQEPHQRVVEV